MNRQRKKKEVFVWTVTTTTQHTKAAAQIETALCTTHCGAHTVCAQWLCATI